MMLIEQQTSAVVPSHYEQSAFDIERERKEAERLLAARKANAVALGQHFERAKRQLGNKAYFEYVRSLGLIPLTAEAFILQARRERGEQPAPYKLREKAFTVADLRMLRDRLKEGDVDGVIAALDEVL